MAQPTQKLSILGLALLMAVACDSGSSEETSTTGDTESTTTSGTTIEPTSTGPVATGSTTSESTTSGPDPDSSSGGSSSEGAESDETTEGVEEVRIGNTPEECIANNQTRPVLPDEAGHFAAATLTPEEYPFEIDRVAYSLRETKDCDLTLAHRVDLIVTNGGTPTDSPSAEGSYESFDMAEEPGAMDPRLIEIVPMTPIVLQEGESLVVMVQMVANAEETQSICLAACEDAPIEPGVDFWSNATDEPYSWQDMVADFGFISNFTVHAYGTVQ